LVLERVPIPIGPDKSEEEILILLMSDQDPKQVVLDPLYITVRFGAAIILCGSRLKIS
jgi:hypothetical protein